VEFNWVSDGPTNKHLDLPCGDQILVLQNVGFWTWELWTAMVPANKTYRRVAVSKASYTEEKDATEHAQEFIMSMTRERSQKLFDRIGKWSNKTFGDEQSRGAKGPLWHMAKELLVEVLGVPCHEYTAIADEYADKTCTHFDEIEIADLLILEMDAIRRAGYSWPQMLAIADTKVAVCETRVYPKPAGDEISEHDRSLDAAPANQ
jgi:hypothetical protein